MAVTTGSFPKALWEGVNQWWGTYYPKYNPEWVHLVDKKTSNKNFEEFVQDTDLGLAPIKTEGQSVSYVTTQQGPTTRATHVVYGVGMIISKEAISDNLYMELAIDKTTKIADSLHHTKETVVANMYNRAFDSNYTFGDGKELCSTAHPNTGGGTFSNMLSTAASLSEASLEDIAIQIGQAETDAGNPARIRPRCLIVPEDLEFEAFRILNSIQRVGTSNNDPNALKDMNIFPEGVKVNHYLSSATRWFVRTDIKKGGLTLFQRWEADYTRDNEFDTQNFKMKGVERYSTTNGDPRSLYASNAA